MNPQSDPLLRIEHISKAFDGVQALADVSFSVAAGEMVALIGPNGAGKTTCFNIVNGQLEADTGSVWLAGKRIDGWPPQRIAVAGVGRTFQTAATFASMTARESVQLALLAGGLGNNRGAIVGAFAVVFLLESTRFVIPLVPGVSAVQGAALRELLIATLLIVMLRYRPRGLIPEQLPRFPVPPTASLATRA